MPNPAVSVASGGVYRMDLTAHPHGLSGVEQQAAMFKRYGPGWPGGVSGIVHQPSIRQYLAQDFETALATGVPPKWAPIGWKASDWSGAPTEEEVDDAYYTRDPRVTTRNVPRPPVDPLPPPPPPDPRPNPVPASALSPVAQRAAELEELILVALTKATTATEKMPTWVAAIGVIVSSAATTGGLLRAVLKALVQLKRKQLGEPTS